MNSTPITCASDGSFWSGLFYLVLAIFAAHADGENLLGPQTNDRAQRLLQTQASVSEESRALSRFQLDRLKDQRNRRRRTDVIHRDFGRQSYTAAAIPHRMALLTLDEQITLARVVIGRRNCQRVEIAAPDVFLNAGGVEVFLQEVPQRRRVEQRSRVAASQSAAEGKIENPDQGVVRLRDEIATEHVGWLKVRPQVREDAGGL